MPKICPKCNKEWPDEFKACPLDGTPLVSKPQQPAGFSLNLGDANAISGGVNMSDNHSINTTSNVDSHNVITNNITQVEREKSPEEIKHERELAFREACLEVYSNGIMTSEQKRKLEDLQYCLGLDESSASKILSEVARRSERKSSSLSPVHQITFNNIKTAINSNRLDLVNRLLAQMKAMVQRYSVEEIQFTYYMLQAVLHPKECIEEYENHREDKYWQSFWSSIAYRRVGNIEKSELLVADVGDKWIDTIPQENVFILATVNALIDNDSVSAKSLYDNISGEHSPFLSNLTTCLYTILYNDVVSPEEQKQWQKDIAFYSNNLFADRIARNIEAKRVENEAEAKRLAEEKRMQEEAEDKRLAEEKRMQEEAEAKRLAEEKRMQEEAEVKRLAEEKRKQEEAEAKRVAEEKRKKEEAEAKRIAKEKHMQEEAEAKRVAEEKRLQEEAEAKRVAEEKQQPTMTSSVAFNANSPKTEEDTLIVEIDDFLNGNHNSIPKIIQLHAEKDNPRALNAMGICYMNGWGVKPNPNKANKLYKKAAGLGFPPAAYNLGINYLRGQGVDQSDIQAAKWLGKAAKMEYPLAQLEYAYMCKYGQGVEQNYDKYREWVQKAAKNGLQDAVDQNINDIENLKKGFSEILNVEFVEERDPNPVHTLHLDLLLLGLKNTICSIQAKLFKTDSKLPIDIFWFLSNLSIEEIRHNNNIAFIPQSDCEIIKHFSMSFFSNKETYKIDSNKWIEYRLEIELLDAKDKIISNCVNLTFSVKRVEHIFGKDEFKILIKEIS